VLDSVGGFEPFSSFVLFTFNSDSCWVACHFGLSFSIAQQWSRLNAVSCVALKSSLASAS
jgi:hypothetical protein